MNDKCNYCKKLLQNGETVWIFECSHYFYCNQCFTGILNEDFSLEIRYICPECKIWAPLENARGTMFESALQQDLDGSKKRLDLSLKRIAELDQQPLQSEIKCSKIQKEHDQLEHKLMEITAKIEDSNTREREMKTLEQCRAEKLLEKEVLRGILQRRLDLNDAEKQPKSKDEDSQ